MKEAFTFDDVLIVPGFSKVESRFDPNTTSPLLDLLVPVISANMDTVTGPRMAIAIEKAGGLGVLHRFYSKEKKINWTRFVAQNNANVAVSLGIGDPAKVTNWAKKLVENRANILVVDVAHGHQKRVLECVEMIRNHIDDITIIAGNIATPEAASHLWNAGADAVKIGIGPGAACTTRTTTGVGYPQFSAINDIYESAPGGLKLIADGGIKNTGDFCKAIAAGADAVMMGSVFAGCEESPGEIIEDCDKVVVVGGGYEPREVDGSRTGRKFKEYRGMASTEAREAFGIAASSGYNEHIAEGVAGRVDYTGPVADTISHYQKALQSAMSYVGASSIAEFQDKAEFVKVSNSTIIESSARI